MELYEFDRRDGLVVRVDVDNAVSIVAMDSDDSRFAPILSLGSAQIAGAVGYLTGNGRLAAKGEPNVPAIGVAPTRAARAAAELSELARVPTDELAIELERRNA